MKFHIASCLQANFKMKIQVNNPNKSVKINKHLVKILLITILFSQAIISAQETEKTTLKNSNGGDIFSNIPSGYEINENANGQYTLTNKYVSSNSILKIGNNNFVLKKGSSIIINQIRKGDKGTQTIELKGEGDITTGLIRSEDSEWGGEQFKGIKDAVIRISEQYSEIEGLESKSSEIKYAEFTSVEGGGYNFIHNKKEYKFKIKKQGRLIFNPEQNIIEAKDTDLEITGEEGENDIEQISLTGESSFKDSNGKTYSSKDQNTLEIFLDGRDVKDKKNAVSIGEGKINLKGKVEITNGLNYKGLTENTYTELDTNNNIFDIKSGDASIDNNKHLILAENGKIKLENKNLASDKQAESFTVKVHNNDEITEAVLDEVSGNLKLTSFKQGYPFQTALIPLSNYEGNLNNPLEIQRAFIRSMGETLTSLRKQGASQEKIDAIELVIANAKNRQYENFLGKIGGLDFSIEELRRYLQEPRTPESKSNAQISLAESLIERASLGVEHARGDSLTEILEKDKDFAYEKKQYLEEARTLLSSIKQSAVQQGNQELSGYADLKIGNTYALQEDYESALKQYYNTAEQNPLNEIKSEAHRYAAEVYLQQDDYKGALQDLDKAVELNPENKQAVESELKLSLEIIRAVDKNLNGELDMLFREVNEKFGIEDYENLFKTPGKVLGLFWKDAGKIIFRDPYDSLREFENKYGSVEKQKIGTIGLSALLADGTDLEEFRFAKYDERLSMMTKALPGDFSERADEFIEASRYTLRENSDIALIAAKGDEQKAREILRERNAPSFESDGKEDWELNEFGFKTGERYAGEIKETWADTISSGLSGGNVVGIMAGGPIVKGVSWGGKAIGLGKAMQQANKLRITAGEALGLATFAKNFPKLAATTKFGTEVGIIYGVDTLAPDLELGFLTSSVIRQAGILDLRDDLTKAGIKVASSQVLRNAKGETVQLLRFETKQSVALAKQMLKDQKGILVLTTEESIPKTVLERGFISSIEGKAIPELVSREVAWKQVAVGDVAGSTRKELLVAPKVYVDPEKYKYLLGELSTASGSKRLPVKYEGGLEKLIDDWVAKKPQARYFVKENMRLNEELTKRAKQANFDDAREYLESARTSLEYKGKVYSYERLRESLDFHDLSRNMEMREAFNQLGIGMNNAKDLENIFVKQIRNNQPFRRGTVNLENKIYEGRIYRGEVVGLNGKKANLQTRWIINEKEELELTTAILDRPPSAILDSKGKIIEVSKRTSKEIRFSEGEWVDRLPISRILLLIIKNN